MPNVTESTYDEEKILEINQENMLLDLASSDPKLTELVIETGGSEEEVSAFVQRLSNALTYNTTLTQLTLKIDGIKSTDIKYFADMLRGNETLEELCLSSNEIDDEGLEHIVKALKANTTLKKLDLSNNKITAEGVEKLAVSLTENSTIEALDLSDNLIKNGALPLSFMLTKNQALRKLSLTKCGFESSEISTICDGLLENWGLTQLDIERFEFSDSVKTFLDRNRDAPRELFKCLKQGKIEQALLYLNQGVSRNYEDKETLLHLASELGDARVVHKLLPGLSVFSKDKNGCTPFLKAIAKGHAEIAMLLCQDDVLFMADNKGNTALHYAIKANNKLLVNWLINRAPSLVNQKNQDKISPLHLAAMLGHDSFVDILIKRHAKINTSDKKGRAPLHYAAENNQVGSIHLLIENNANLNRKDKLDYTPLHYAAENGHEEAVAFLLEKGANFRAKNKQDRTAQDVAKDSGVQTIIQQYTSTKTTNRETRQTYQGTFQILDILNQDDCEDFYIRTGMKVEIPQGKDSIEWKGPSGNFGEIKLALDLRNGEYIAAKCIRGVQKIAESEKEALVQSSLLGVENIVQLYGSYAPEVKPGETPELYQFMPYLGFGDGKKFQDRLANFNDPKLPVTNPLFKLRCLTHAAKQLINGVHKMHQHGVVHSDLKPQNILIDCKGGFYVSDFGLAKQFTIEPEQKSPSFMMSELKGTVIYRAPEIWQSIHNKTSYDGVMADTWAVGLILLEWTGCTLPIFSPDDKKRYFEEITQLPELQNAEEGDLFDLIKQLLNPDPNARLTLKDASKFPLFELDYLKFPTAEAVRNAFEKLAKADKPQIEPPSPMNKVDSEIIINEAKDGQYSLPRDSVDSSEETSGACQIDTQSDPDNNHSEEKTILSSPRFFSGQRPKAAPSLCHEVNNRR